MTEHFVKGDIVTYPYLWRWQDDKGQEHGEKDRPVCLLLAMRDDKDNTHILLLPISSAPPYSGQTALEIPALELKRAKLRTSNAAGLQSASAITISLANPTIST
ncbi:hypothetical protein [Rhizobium sp. 007]|uniref:hypothetical protein n=1 Tax=Rhizobium sp. 007 TaxID=2785056 RepID=UPI00188FC194|nr:hypothetical protein [Rhizobium sp. 007]QPB22874.1 hypothetical protein ISN39_25285 [Rhizobium sp. 007]